MCVTLLNTNRFARIAASIFLGQRPFEQLTCWNIKDWCHCWIGLRHINGWTSSRNHESRHAMIPYAKWKCLFSCVDQAYKVHQCIVPGHCRVLHGTKVDDNMRFFTRSHREHSSYSHTYARRCHQTMAGASWDYYTMLPKTRLGRNRIPDLSATQRVVERCTQSRPDTLQCLKGHIFQTVRSCLNLSQ